MIKTGYEIIGMIKDGKAPKKIKSLVDKTIYNWKEDYFEYNNENEYGCIELLYNLNAEFEIIEENKVWEPKKHEVYWYITSSDKVYSTPWDNTEFDIFIYEIGNCFKTEEEAKKILEKIKIYTQLKRYAEEHNTEKIDFEKSVHYIGYDYSDKMVRIYTSFNVKTMNNIYFTSRGICEKAIKEIGEDNIKKLFEE